MDTVGIKSFWNVEVVSTGRTDGWCRVLFGDCMSHSGATVGAGPCGGALLSICFVSWLVPSAPLSSNDQVQE